MWEEEAGREFRIYFTSARIEKQIYNAMEVPIGNDAITHLVSVADEIRSQAQRIGNSACVYQEENLARLVDFFCGLAFWTEQKISREAAVFFLEKGEIFGREMHFPSV